MTHESGISDFRLRPSVDAVALGLISANADVTLGAMGLRITATGSTPPALTAQATSLVAERLSLRGLPDEELIVIATGSGARRIAASFGQDQVSTRPAAAFAVHVIDAPARRVEIIDRATGHSLATRTLAEDGTFNAYGMRFALDGPLETGDRFYVRENQNGTGDARNALALFALGERNARTGLGGFGAEFATLVTNTGAETRSATIAQSGAEARRDAAVELEAEYSGVNLDDEAARLLEQQQAYQALARVLRTAGELLDTLLNAIS
jgi:flagellar hook-associated protein 1 FlgK